MNKIKTIFIGTSSFGVPSLLSLIKDDNFEIQAVISQADKKIGRKQILTETPIKKIAQENKIKVFQPTKIKEISKEIKDLSPDLIIVIAYAQIIPEIILEIPRYHCLNVHSSLLPRYRGASCIQASLLNNDSETGVTIMRMDKGLDTGPIIHQEKIKIEADDTADDLFDKLSSISGQIISSVVKKYINQELQEKIQDKNLASIVGLLKKQDGLINWHNNAEQIKQHIRAMYPWPGAFFKYEKDNFSKNIKLIKINNKILQSNKNKIGNFFIEDNKLAIQCKKDAVIIDELQIEGKNIISAKEFMQGYKNII